jgi:hypothetical protein
MKRSQESQIKSIRFDVEKLYEIIKEDLKIEECRRAALEIANKLTHDIATLGSDEQR